MVGMRFMCLASLAIATASQAAAQTIGPMPSAPADPAGDTAPAGAAPETLGQAIGEAYASNPRLQSQRAQLRVIDEGVIQASSPYRLNLGFVGTVQYQQGPTRDFTGDLVGGSNRNFTGALTASQILLNGGRTAAQVSAAEADVLSARERLRELENFILLEVVDSYVSVRRDQQVVAIQQRSADSYRRQVDQARARERGGDLTTTDIAQAEAQYGISLTQLAQAQSQLQASRARFAVVVGRNPGQLIAEPDLPGLPISLDTAYKVAADSSPTLWQAILNVRGARQRIAAARAEGSPQLTVQGRVGYSTLDTLRTNDLRFAAAGSATLTFPLLAQGIIASRTRAAVADEQRIGYLLEDAKRQVDQQVQAAWNQSVAARESLAAGETAVNAAETALRGVRAGFLEGFRSNFEVLDSEQRLLNAQLIVANARYNRYTGRASLLAYLGKLEAAAIEQTVTEYDKASYLNRQSARQIGPFNAVLEPFDKLQKPSTKSRPSPVVSLPADPSIKPATTPPPVGPLGTALPVTATPAPAPEGLPPGVPPIG